jgi:propionyl-CoA carboxylase alpha chain
LAPAPDVESAARAAIAHQPAGEVGLAEILAPMPGAVLTVHAALGQALEAGDPIITLEAMKMEHIVVAPIGGRVTELRAQPADQVVRGQLLAIVKP